MTSEAGLNDGLAFPFVYAALAVAAEGSAGNWLGDWIITDLVGRLIIGIAVGWFIGRVLGRVSFDPPGKLVALADAQDGFVALAATLLAYGVAELAHGYGFLAVFVAAIALRDSERGHSFHRVLHNFAGQVEQLVVIALLVLFGGAVATGMLSALSWSGAALGLALIVVIRPVTGRLSLIGARVSAEDRGAISFFGIRGVGSIYYLAFALARDEFPQSDELWSIVAFTIMASIVVHGVTSTPVMQHLDRRRAGADVVEPRSAAQPPIDALGANRPRRDVDRHGLTIPTDQRRPGRRLHTLQHPRPTRPCADRQPRRGPNHARRHRSRQGLHHCSDSDRPPSRWPRNKRRCRSKAGGLREARFQELEVHAPAQVLHELPTDPA